jgi:hypothetical protein
MHKTMKWSAGTTLREHPALESKSANGEEFGNEDLPQDLDLARFFMAN